jgi:hypothetical protein
MLKEIPCPKMKKFFCLTADFEALWKAAGVSAALCSATTAMTEGLLVTFRKNGWKEVVPINRDRKETFHAVLLVCSDQIKVVI